MKRNLYAVVAIKHVAGKADADAEAARAATLGFGRTVVLPVAWYGEECRKGADHAHARYDGATFCMSCGKFLSVQISKSRGSFRR